MKTILYAITLYALTIGFGCYLKTAQGGEHYKGEGGFPSSAPGGITGRIPEPGKPCREYLAACEKSCAAPGPVLLSSIPLADHRYNHRYPIFLHKDARRIVVPATDLATTADPQARLTRGIPVVKAPQYRVTRGLDMLKVSLWTKLNLADNNFFGILEFMKKKVQDTENDCIPVFKENGFDWNLYRTGARMYTFRLKSGDITLLFNRRKHGDNIPNCRLEIGSLSCWSPGFYSITSG